MWIFFTSFCVLLLLVEGVSGDEKVEVMEGDSVTLKHNTSITDLNKDDMIVWKINNDFIVKMTKTAGVFTFKDVLERLRDRLELDQTGFLTITNIKTTDTGLYHLNVKTSTEIMKNYNVTVREMSGVDPDGVKIVSVMKGDTVPLFAGVSEIQKNDQIQFWKLGNPDVLIANLSSKSWNNIRLNDKTGKLDIIDIQSDQSGDYRVEFITSSMNLQRKFRININEDVESKSVMEGQSVTLNTGVTNMQSDDLIVWKFKDEVIPFPSLNGPVDESWSNIYLNDQTGELTISNIQRNQTGVYEVNTSSMILHRKFSINVAPDKPTPGPGLYSAPDKPTPDPVPDKPAPVSGLSSGAVAGIVVVLLLLFAAVIAAAVIYHRHKISELERRRDVEKKETNDPLNAETANSGAS